MTILIVYFHIHSHGFMWSEFHFSRFHPKCQGILPNHSGGRLVETEAGEL